MKEFPRIEGERIVLRKLEVFDLDSYLEYVRDVQIRKQFNFEYTEKTATERFNELIKRYDEERKPFVWVIASLENDNLLGIISADDYSFVNKSFSLACGVMERYRGHGYAYEAARYLISYIFTHLGMHRLEIAHNIDNIASQKTIEKMGAKFEGIARQSKYYDDEFKDRKIYSILKNEWLKKEES